MVSLWLEYALPMTDVQHKIIPKVLLEKRENAKVSTFVLLFWGVHNVSKKIVMGLSK
jgi:hypothetical protein